MIKLLKLEWLKFRKNSVVKMLVVIFIIAFPLILFIGNDDSIDFGKMFNKRAFYVFPTVWDWMGYIGNWLVFFCLGFLMVYIVSIERGYKTMRQNMIAGLSRNEYLFSKLLILLSFALFATLYYALVSLAIGWFSTDGASFSVALDNNWAISRFFLMSLGYLSFALICGFMIKNSGLAVLSYLAYGIILEPIIRYALSYNIEGNYHKYFPLNAMEDLHPNPVWKISEFINKSNSTLLLPQSHAVIVSIIFVLIFVMLVFLYFKKSDL